MVRDSNGANNTQATGTPALREDQVGPPFCHRNARFGEDGRPLEGSRFEEGVVVDFTILFDPDLPP